MYEFHDIDYGARWEFEDPTVVYQQIPPGATIYGNVMVSGNQTGGGGDRGGGGGSARLAQRQAQQIEIEDLQKLVQYQQTIAAGGNIPPEARAWMTAVRAVNPKLFDRAYNIVNKISPARVSGGGARAGQVAGQTGVQDTRGGAGGRGGDVSGPTGTFGSSSYNFGTQPGPPVPGPGGVVPPPVPVPQETGPDVPPIDFGPHEDIGLGDLPIDKGGGGPPPGGGDNPPTIKPGTPPITEFVPGSLPGVSMIPGLLGMGAGILGGLGTEPRFNRMEEMRRWDKEQGNRYKGIWKDSETNPYEGDFFRNAQRTMVTGTNAMIEQDAQKQAMQAAAAGGTVFAGGNQRALAAMAPSFYQQTGANLSRGYDIRNQAANFRENTIYNNTNYEWEQWQDDYQNGRLPEQNRGINLVNKVVASGLEGYQLGKSMAADDFELNAKKKMYEQGLGRYEFKGGTPGGIEIKPGTKDEIIKPAVPMDMSKPPSATAGLKPIVEQPFNPLGIGKTPAKKKPFRFFEQL